MDIPKFFPIKIQHARKATFLRVSHVIQEKSINFIKIYQVLQHDAFLLRNANQK